ncbi:MAG: hypothetical protein E6R04_08885 [Spirochaetes bacterium]|nr:MAG: hypothetical protein E6R04_08885 [Spirochaetota bacterium]
MSSNKLEIVSQPGSFELDVKRFYIPGLVFKCQCPVCGLVVHKDMKDDYFSYPEANDSVVVWFYCVECDKNWYAGLVFLKITVELVEPQTEE